MKDSIILFLFLIPAFLFAQYPTTGNKSRLGWQTTGDGLIWRGVAADTVNKPNNRNYPYFQLDTVNAVLYRYIQTRQQWQPVGGAVDIDSLIYATRFWVNSNFFPLQGGLLTGAAGAGFVGFPVQSSPPSTPSTGFSLFAGSTGNNISWMQPDGFFRRLVSPMTGTPRQYQFMARSYTLADSADVAALPTGSGTTNYYTKWTSSTALGIGNMTDNNTVVSILNSKPFSLGQWTTAGRPAGTAGYMGFRLSGINGVEWYNGTRWAYALESTFARGTATRIPFFDANGQITDNSGITFQNPGTIAGTAYSSLRVTTSATATANSQFLTGTIFTTTNTPGAFTGVRNHVAAFLTDDATGSTIAIGRPYSNNFFATITSDFGTRNFIFDSGTGGGNLIFRKAGTQVLSVGSPRLAYAGSFFSSATESLYGLNTSFGSEVGTSAFLLFREGSTTGYKAAFGHDANGGAVIYAQRANTNFISTDMKLRLSGATGYAEFLNNTGGVLLGGGTTAQTPTEANGLIRYNSDSTLYQIYQGGARAYIATRAYARSIALNIGNSNLTLTGNRTLSSGGFGLTLAPKTTMSDTLLLPLGKVKTNTYAPIIGKNVNWAENGSVMYGENLRKDSTGYGAGANVLYGISLMQKARPGGGRFSLFGDNIMNGVTNAFNVVGIGIQVADQSTTAGSDFFIGGTVVARYATNLDRAVIVANRSFNRAAGVNLAQTVAFGYGHGSTSTERSTGGTHYGYSQLPALVDGQQVSTYGYLAGRTIKRGTNLSFIGNYTGATDTMFSDASAIGNHAAIGQNQSITIGAINGVNSATYDAKIGFGTVVPATKFHLVGIATFGSYGTTATTAAALSKTESGYVAGFATDGTVTSREIKRDTTVYIDDADHDWGAAITTAQIASRFNRVIFWMTTTAAAGSDSELTLHTPDANLMQVEYLIHSVDEPAGFDNKIVFGTNNAVDSTNGLVTNYYPAAGDGIHIRAGLRSGVYKYRYSN